MIENLEQLALHLFCKNKRGVWFLYLTDMNKYYVVEHSLWATLDRLLPNARVI